MRVKYSLHVFLHWKFCSFKIKSPLLSSHSYILSSFLPLFIPSFHLSFLPSFLTFLPSFLSFFLPSFFHSFHFLTIFLPFFLPLLSSPLSLSALFSFFTLSYFSSSRTPISLLSLVDHMCIYLLHLSHLVCLNHFSSGPKSRIMSRGFTSRWFHTISASTNACKSC